MRRVYLVAIALGILVFLAVSGLLARVFSADSAERSAITTLVQAEARGDQRAIVKQIKGCSKNSACRARAASDAHALKHRGSVAILQLEPSTGFSITSTVGQARVAWKAGRSLPIVQCVRVRRAGNVVSGLRIELLAVSARLKGSASCSG
jgi:hypothetical protein